jgi:hypothetical protein
MPPSRRKSATFLRNCAYATGFRPSSWPTRPGWSGPVTSANTHAPTRWAASRSESYRCPPRRLPGSPVRPAIRCWASCCSTGGSVRVVSGPLSWRDPGAYRVRPAGLPTLVHRPRPRSADQGHRCRRRLARAVPQDVDRLRAGQTSFEPVSAVGLVADRADDLGGALAGLNPGMTASRGPDRMRRGAMRRTGTREPPDGEADGREVGRLQIP